MPAWSRFPKVSIAIDHKPSAASRGRAAPAILNIWPCLNDLFKHGQIFKIAGAALPRDAADGLWSIAIETFGNLDQAGILENLEVTAEIAVGQAAQLLEIAEHH